MINLEELATKLKSDTYWLVSANNKLLFVRILKDVTKRNDKVVIDAEAEVILMDDDNYEYAKNMFIPIEGLYAWNSITKDKFDTIKLLYEKEKE